MTRYSKIIIWWCFSSEISLFWKSCFHLLENVIPKWRHRCWMCSLLLGLCRIKKCVYMCGTTYPSWASLVAQLVKNSPAMQETWVGKVFWRRERYPLQYSGLENSMNYTAHGVAKSRTQMSDFHFTLLIRLSEKQEFILILSTNQHYPFHICNSFNQ